MSGVLAQKFVATGNDFIFLSEEDVHRIPLSRSDLARRLCDRHFGIGADGMVIMSPPEDDLRFSWDFYNDDGSKAEMCGNATRCAGRWAAQNHGLKRIELKTVAGQVNVTEEKDSQGTAGPIFASRMTYLHPTSSSLSVSLSSGRTYEVTFVNTGVPHAVVEVDQLEAPGDQAELIRLLRFHTVAGERGANVTFLQKLRPGLLATKTFERGVENFTLSCGTGVLAAAIVGLRVGVERAIELKTPGGRLRVDLGGEKVIAGREENELAGAGPSLIGSAKFLFETEITEELLR